MILHGSVYVQEKDSQGNGFILQFAMSVATVFVTVGTTKFDGLAQAVLQPQVQNALKEKGYERILLQYGKSNVEWPSEKGTD